MSRSECGGVNCVLSSQLGLLVPKGGLTSGVSSADSVVLQAYVG